jgi:hypothetical protein
VTCVAFGVCHVRCEVTYRVTRVSSTAIAAVTTISTVPAFPTISCRVGDIVDDKIKEL